MQLYERDYSVILTEEEKRAYEEELQYENSGITFGNSKLVIRNNRVCPRFLHPNKEIRDFIWQHRSLYPNNYLRLAKFQEEVFFEDEADEFERVLDDAKNEQEFQRYIKSNRKWFIPGSVFLEYNFGHHDSYLFPEQKLGTDYVVDYMLLGKNSDGFSIVFVEFEEANADFILKTSNSESEAVRKGLTQIKDWKRWMDANREFFMRNTGMYKLGIDVPTYRMHYCLVVSRRELISDRAKELRSQLMFEMQNVNIVSYDRLLDNMRRLDGYKTW